MYNDILQLNAAKIIFINVLILQSQMRMFKIEFKFSQPEISWKWVNFN